MKTLFVLFILLFSFSSQGSFLDVSQKLANEREEDKQLWDAQEAFRDMSLSSAEVYRWQISFQLIEELLEQDSRETICFSIQPQVEDHNNAMDFEYFFQQITGNHFDWMQNIGRCTKIYHFSHGRMMGQNTHPRMYDVSIEEIASELFPELKHLSKSCRGSYEWLGEEPGVLSEENEELLLKEMPMIESKIKADIKSEHGIGNLSFTNPMGHWSYNGYADEYNRYIEE